MIRLADVLAANPDARLHGPALTNAWSGWGNDSRVIVPATCFVAVRTERADGHDHIAAALDAGATGVLCQRPFDAAPWGATCIVVPDTRTALQRWAAARVRDLGRPVVGVTGSVGKTTTKELVAHVLSGALATFRNPGNLNDLFGLPIALGGLDGDPDVLVLEMGTDRVGEIEALCDLFSPTVGLVTRVAEAHLHALGNLAGVAREKGALVQALPPDGLAVLNADDPHVAAMAGLARAAVVTVSAAGDPAADVRALGVTLARDGTRFTIATADVTADGTADGTADSTADGTADGEPTPARLPWLGAHFVTSALMAVAVGRRFGLPLATIVERLATLPPQKGRLNPLPGRAGSLILDDSYNASPAAVLAALDVLATLEAGARIAVLGDMAELGDAAEEGHRRVGRRAAAVVDRLVTCGEQAAWIADEARRAGLAPERIVVTHRTADAAEAVLAHLGPDAIVLTKGSAVTRMERVSAALLAEPERAGELLVRQDAAWRQIVVLRPGRPTWLEIDLGALAHNTAHLKALAGDAALMAVIKADGYGHGAVQVARTALRHGATWLGVACVPEAAAIRQAGIDAPTLILGYTPAWQARGAAALDVAVAVYDDHTARALADAALALDRPVRVHVKVDTGLHRLGLPPEEAPAFLAALAAMPGLVVEGIFTHLAVADDPSAAGRAATEAQLAAFAALLAALERAGQRPPLAHALNSAGLLGYPQGRFDLVRPGIALYGLAPSAEVGDPALRPVLSWKAQVAQVHDLPPGAAVGYGRTWTAARPSRVATIPVGYADGFRRAPARWRHVLVRGRPAPLVGRVSMDQAAIDVTDIPGVRQGDEVVLIGHQHDDAGTLQAITADDVAAWLGTIGYEVVSSILARVARVS